MHIEAKVTLNTKKYKNIYIIRLLRKYFICTIWFAATLCLNTHIYAQDAAVSIPVTEDRPEPKPEAKVEKIEPKAEAETQASKEKGLDESDGKLNFDLVQSRSAVNKDQKTKQLRGDKQRIKQEVARLEAEINREIQKMPKQSKRVGFTAVSPYEKYYKNIRSTIEEYGINYFPKDSFGKPIYGELILVIRINKNGALGYNKDQYYAKPLEIARSSGNPLLDKHAIEIVKACAPFGQFSKEMAQKIDILEVISTFKFNKQGFATTLQGR
jgi:outer membrane biosynthesis protein TonB